MITSNAIAKTTQLARRIPVPQDYFKGVAAIAPCLPTNILLFTRTNAIELQQRTFASLPHHRYVLVICLESAGTVYVDNLTLPLAPGQGLLVFPFQFHHYSDLEHESIQWLFLSFEYSDSSKLSVLRNSPVELSNAALAALHPAIEAFTAGTDPEEVVLHSSLLLRRTVECQPVAYLKRQIDAPHGQGVLLHQINVQLDQSPTDPPSITVIASRLGYSERRLREIFRLRFGLPLGLYIRRHRMTRMMALLHRSDLNLTEIAFECGYNSLAAFSRAFKTLTGDSPREFRKGK